MGRNLAIVACAFCAFAAPVAATTITLDSAHATYGPYWSVPVSLPYQEGNYSLSAAGGLYYLGSGDSRYPGGSNMFNAGYYDVTTLSTVDSTAFNIDSIKLSKMFFGDEPASLSVTFTGAVFGGGTVSQTFNVTTVGFQDFTFNEDFSNLTSVSWGNYETFSPLFGAIEVEAYVAPTRNDDTLLAVPEVSSWTMMLLGFGLMRGMVRNHRRESRPITR